MNAMNANEKLVTYYIISEHDAGYLQSPDSDRVAYDKAGLRSELRDSREYFPYDDGYEVMTPVAELLKMQPGESDCYLQAKGNGLWQVWVSAVLAIVPANGVYKESRGGTLADNDLHYSDNVADFDSFAAYIRGVCGDVNNATGIYYLVQESEIAELWVTESSRPFDDTAHYSRVYPLGDNGDSGDPTPAVINLDANESPTHEEHEESVNESRIRQIIEYLKLVHTCPKVVKENGKYTYWDDNTPYDETESGDMVAAWESALDYFSDEIKDVLYTPGKLAQQLIDKSTKEKNSDDTEYRSFNLYENTTPAWMLPLNEAYDNLDESEYVHDALTDIVISGYTDIEQLRDMADESEGDIYTKDLIKWLVNDPGRLHDVDDIIREYGELPKGGLESAIRYAQAENKREIFLRVVDFIESAIDELKSESL